MEVGVNILVAHVNTASVHWTPSLNILIAHVNTAIVFIELPPWTILIAHVNTAIVFIELTPWTKKTKQKNVWGWMVYVKSYEILCN